MAYWCINMDTGVMPITPYPTVIDARKSAIKMIKEDNPKEGVMISKYVTPLSNAEGVVQKIENGYVWISHGKNGKKNTDPEHRWQNQEVISWQPPPSPSKKR